MFLELIFIKSQMASNIIYQNIVFELSVVIANDVFCTLNCTTVDIEKCGKHLEHPYLLQEGIKHINRTKIYVQPAFRYIGHHPNMMRWNLTNYISYNMPRMLSTKLFPMGSIAQHCDLWSWQLGWRKHLVTVIAMSFLMAALHVERGLLTDFEPRCRYTKWSVRWRRLYWWISTLKPKQNSHQFDKQHIESIFLKANFRILSAISFTYVRWGLFDNTSSVQTMACSEQATSQNLIHWWPITDVYLCQSASMS